MNRSITPLKALPVVVALLLAACSSDGSETANTAAPTAETAEKAAPSTATAATEPLPAITEPSGSTPEANADAGSELADAAAKLGVTVAELEDALGAPPPDLEAAAAALGVSVADLEAALPAPPDAGGTGEANTALASDIPAAALEAAAEGTDITNVILTSQSIDCTDYVDLYSSNVTDLSQGTEHQGGTSVSVTNGGCLVESNNIPNHDFADASSAFATLTSANGLKVTIPSDPVAAAEPVALSQRSYNAVMLNGVVLDILSAGCYDPGAPGADADGNTAIGCSSDDPWLIDPMGAEHKFGTDEHNAHTQPDGRYHYHASPNALYEDAPSEGGSPVIGFAADGFPVFGPYFVDPDTGEVREAISGYTLKQGERPSGEGDPGGTYNGIYNNDYEYSGTGDLDECNGMTVDGSYGYYVTNGYPWVINCFTGTPDQSFSK